MTRRLTSIGPLVVLTLTGCGGKTQDVAYTNLTQRMQPLEFTRITRDVFRNRESLLEVLERNNPGKKIALPAIDFSRHEVYLVAAGPRSSTGYELQVVSVRDVGGRINVTIHERTPTLGDSVAPRVTYPFLLIELPRSDEPVKLKWPGRP